MIFRVQVLPISQLMTVEVIAESRSSSLTFRHLGWWTNVRDLLARNLIGAVQFASIEAALSRELPMSLSIDTSPEALCSARFVQLYECPTSSRQLARLESGNSSFSSASRKSALLENGRTYIAFRITGTSAAKLRSGEDDAQGTRADSPGAPVHVVKAQCGTIYEEHYADA